MSIDVVKMDMYNKILSIYLTYMKDNSSIVLRNSNLNNNNSKDDFVGILGKLARGVDPLIVGNIIKKYDAWRKRQDYSNPKSYLMNYGAGSQKMKSRSSKSNKTNNINQSRGYYMRRSGNGGNGKPPKIRKSSQLGDNDNNNNDMRKGSNYGSRMGRGTNTADILNSSSAISSRFRTGINSGITTSLYEPGSINWSPLYCQQIFITPTGTGSSDDPDKACYTEYMWEEVILPIIKTELMRRINVNINSYISDSLIRTAIENNSMALQIYYTVESVLSYSDNYVSANVGMNHLSSMIRDNATLIHKHELLRERLATCFLPPKLVSFIKYNYDLYSWTNLPGASILKQNFGQMFGFKEAWVTPDDSKPWTHTYGEGLYDSILNILSTDDYLSTNSYLVKAFPDYEIKDPGTYSSVAKYDIGFLTYWTNSIQAVQFNNDTGVFGFNLFQANENNQYRYFIYDNDLDGSVVASLSCYIGEDSFFNTGLIEPAEITNLTAACVGANRQTRFAYISNELGGINEDYYENSGWARNLIYDTDIPTTNTFTYSQAVPGCMRSTYFSTELSKQACYSMINWLFGMSF